MAFVPCLCLFKTNFMTITKNIKAAQGLIIPSLDLQFPVSLACAANTDLLPIVQPEDCDDVAGVKRAFIIKRSDIDHDTILATQFDTVNSCYTGFTFFNSQRFREIPFERVTGTYAFEYSRDTRLYDNTVTLTIEGKRKLNYNAYCNLVRQCDLVVAIITNNCNIIIMGNEFINGQFNRPVRRYEVGTHSAISNTLGDGTRAGDTFSFVGQSFCHPLWADITEDDFVTNFVFP